MLLLVTIGLVLVGAVALVIGFVSNSLGPIYLSIACSVIAGIVLVVFSRMARRQEAAPSAAPAPERARTSWEQRTPTPPAPTPTAPTPTAPTPPAPTPPPPAPVPRRAPVSRPERAPAKTTRGAPAGAAAATLTAPRPGAGGFSFPIEDYDGLRASQILPLLGELSLDELDMVREREEQGKNRATVLNRVDLRIDELEAAEDGDGGGAAAYGGAAEVPGPAAEGHGEAEGDDDFPIPAYDSLSADEIIARLDDLDDDEVDMVAAREERGLNRVEILDYIDSMFEEVGPEGEAAPAPAAAAAPAARPAAKKSAAKKSAAKKAPAKAVAAKKAAVKKAPAAKAAPRKATAKKAAVTASPGTKSAGPRSAAGPAKATKASKGKAAAKQSPAAKKR